jgi:hypothetical protein
LEGKNKDEVKKNKRRRLGGREGGGSRRRRKNVVEGMMNKHERTINIVECYDEILNNSALC